MRAALKRSDIRCSRCRRVAVHSRDTAGGGKRLTLPGQTNVLPLADGVGEVLIACHWCGQRYSLCGARVVIFVESLPLVRVNVEEEVPPVEEAC